MTHFMRCVYLEGGREYPYFDCYGIVIAVRAHLGLSELPPYAQIRKGQAMHEAVTGEIPNYRKCAPEHGAIAICWHGQLARHIGIVVELDGILRVMEINPRKNVTLPTVPVFERRYRKVEYFT